MLVVEPSSHALMQALVAIGLLALLRLESRLERGTRRPPATVDTVAETLSLSVFKWVRDLLAVAAGFEVTMGSGLSTPLTVVSGILVLGGVGLRLAAISALGDMWSFHPVRYHQHRLVRDGIYRYFSHPAYLGNIYLPSLFLCVGAPLSASLALLMIVIFYYYRTRVEATMLANLSDD